VCRRNFHAIEKTQKKRGHQRDGIRRKVSREDTRSSGSRDEYHEVRTPWLEREVVTSKEDEIQSKA
jgi:hypothetical protein